MKPLDLAREAAALVVAVLEQPRPPTPAAHYAALSLHAIDELAEGVISELEAQRRNNAIRLVRHVWEFELEMAWVLAEPETRIERWRVTEARRRRLMRDPTAERTDERLERLLAEEYERARERGAAFMPNVEQMATELARADRYRSEYRSLSYLSHPGLWGTANYADVSEADVERAWKGEVDLGATVLRRRPPDPETFERVALQLVLSIGRAMEPAERVLGVGLRAPVQALMTSFAQIVSERSIQGVKMPPWASGRE
jgi:hypothetical protein